MSESDKIRKSPAQEGGSEFGRPRNKSGDLTITSAGVPARARAIAQAGRQRTAERTQGFAKISLTGFYKLSGL